MRILPKSPIKRRKKMMIKPKGSILIYFSRASGGRKPCKILEPSNGGMGTRLKIARRRFMKTAKLRTCPKKPDSGKILNIIEKMIASPMLAAGPAAPTSIISLFGSLKLYGFMGTGFAHPKTMRPLVVKRRTNGRIMVPKISMWGSGLRVSLPENFAVGSPLLSAAYPCETSCTIMEKKRIAS